MSKLSSFLHQAADYVSGLVHQAPPEAQDTVTKAAEALKNAGAAIEGALPVLVKVAVDAMLSSIGYGKYIPDMNSLIDMFIGELQNRKTVPTVK